MRTRDEIMKEVEKGLGLATSEDQAAAFGRYLLRLNLEVLLDIRELLTPKGPRTVHPESAPPPKVT